MFFNKNNNKIKVICPYCNRTILNALEMDLYQKYICSKCLGGYFFVKLPKTTFTPRKLS
jgi:DNA-directed RNA polymerase subunit RPC12/RpoP